jgi:ABC-type branched-subunit amino acid transport system substrate-binding protein
MLVPLSLSCGGEKGVVTIHIGQLTDFTGAASPALKQITYITEDMIRYYNDENIIPGVKLKLDAYDTKFDPSRYSLGYDWCKQKGDDVIITIIADAPLMLKPFAARDKIVLAAMGGSPELFTPPGWVFGFSSANEDSGKILLHWIVGNDWKGEGTPKIGMVGWNDTQSTSVANAVEAYLKAHPDEYDYVDRITTPVGQYTFTSEAKRLKDEGVDYVAAPSGAMFAALLRDLRAAGSQATLLDCEGGMGSFQTMYAQLVGWDLLDGQYSTANSFYWTDTASPIVDLATTLVHRYHSAGEAQDIISGGNAYVGPAFMMTGILEVLQQAVKNVGAENFNGQAYYDAALNYKTTSSIWGGCPEFSFSQTRRKLMYHSLITEFKGGSVQNYVTLSDWLPDLVD